MQKGTSFWIWIEKEKILDLNFTSICTKGFVIIYWDTNLLPTTQPSIGEWECSICLLERRNYGEKRCFKFLVFYFIDLLQVVHARVFIVYSQIKEGARANADQLFKLLWP